MHGQQNIKTAKEFNILDVGVTSKTIRRTFDS